MSQDSNQDLSQDPCQNSSQDLDQALNQPSSAESTQQTVLKLDGLPLAMPVSKPEKKKAKRKKAADNPLPKPAQSDSVIDQMVQTVETTPEERSRPLKRERQVFSVSGLTQHLKGVIARDPDLSASLTVEGELSNVKRSSRGHLYFTLKDAQASINGVIWASLSKKLAFAPEDGLAVYLTGKLDIYAAGGSYSIVATGIEPVGIGALQMAFQQTKARLEAEGLFMPDFKKALPAFPLKIGMVTAITGAVIHDMLRVIRQKNTLVSVLIYPVKVQGDGAADEIATAIETLNQRPEKLDVLIVGRGGGSFEDLFCFSEEPVVRAVFNSTIPVITGIGHQPDFSLADAAADYSASTPTAAAEACVPDADALLHWVKQQQAELSDQIKLQLQQCEQRLDAGATQLLHQTDVQLTAAQEKLLRQKSGLMDAAAHYFTRQEMQLSSLASELNAYSPLNTLARGYAAITRTDEMDQSVAVSSIQQVNPNDSLALRLQDGLIRSTVTHKEEKQNLFT